MVEGRGEEAVLTGGDDGEDDGEDDVATYPAATVGGL